MARRGVNKAIILGNIGSDPEVKYTPSGKAVANFTVATNESWKDAGGQQQERTEWHRIVAWGKLGEICGEYLRKGAQVYMEGRIQTRSWEDQNGGKRYTTEIVINEMQMLGKKSDSTAGGGDGSYGGSAASGSQSQAAPAPEQASGTASPGPIADDDLPF